MISLDLICGRDHVFEAWFRSAGAFNTQQAAGDIACPMCGSSQVYKAPAGVKHGAGELGEGGEEQLARDLIQALERLCRSMDITPEDLEEDTGETRRGKDDPRSIRRDASRSDRSALLDEGIEVIRIPWIRRRHNS